VIAVHAVPVRKRSRDKRRPRRPSVPRSSRHHAKASWGRADAVPERPDPDAGRAAWRWRPSPAPLTRVPTPEVGGLPTLPDGLQW